MDVRRQRNFHTAGQCHLPVHKFPLAAASTAFATPDEYSFQFNFCPEQVLPLVPGCVPDQGQHARIKPNFEFSTQIAIEGPAFIEVTTPQESSEVPMPLFWQKGEYAFGEEYIAVTGPFSHDSNGGAEPAVRKDGRCQ